jgi:hypothetical protein
MKVFSIRLEETIITGNIQIPPGMKAKAFKPLDTSKEVATTEVKIPEKGLTLQPGNSFIIDDGEETVSGSRYWYCYVTLPVVIHGTEDVLSLGTWGIMAIPIGGARSKASCFDYD